MADVKKIVWLAHEGLLSGANLCLLEHAGILIRRGYSIHLITPRLGELSEAAKLLGIPSHEIYFYGWTTNPFNKESWIGNIKRQLRNRLAIEKIKTLLRSIQPDFVATNTIAMNIGAISAKQSGINHIWFVHEFGEEDHGFSIVGGMTQAKKKMNALSHKIAVNSKAVYKTYQDSIPKAKLHIVHYAVSLTTIAKQNKKEKNELQLVMLGQIASSKNQAEAIEAVARCRRKGLSITLKIYGNIVQEMYAQELKELINRYEMQAHISLHTPVRDIGSLLPAFDALLMCSRAEAFGRVTVEALKCGLPVIGASSGATPELIQNGVNGYLYEAGQADDLARSIEQMMQSKDNFNSRGIAAAAQALYNEENTFLELKEIFN